METTDLFGIPVPSTDPVFLAFVIVHIAISLVAVISGLLAMFSEKTSTRHRANGRVYFWSISISFVTVLILSFMRWPHNIHLLTIGVLTFGLAFLGRKLAKGKITWMDAYSYYLYGTILCSIAHRFLCR
jgi:uncharacterized membrane protein